MEVDDALPGPGSIALRGRAIGWVCAPADAGRLAGVAALVRSTGLAVREAHPGAELGEAARGAARVVLWWSAAAAAGPDVSRLRAVTGGVGGDRLLVLRLDRTPVPPLLAGRVSSVVERCLAALAEAPDLWGAEAVAHRLATLRRVTRWGAGVAVGGAVVAGGLWGVFGGSAEALGARVAALAVLCALVPVVGGVSAMVWAWLDRWSLARRVASYLVDRELEVR